jgi:hypothetical protein
MSDPGEPEGRREEAVNDVDPLDPDAARAATVDARIERLTAERDAARTEAARLEAVKHAASYLLKLKDGPRDAYYVANKDRAWEILRAALSPPTLPTLPAELVAQDEAAMQAERQRGIARPVSPLEEPR